MSKYDERAEWVRKENLKRVGNLEKPLDRSLFIDEDLEDEIIEQHAQIRLLEKKVAALNAGLQAIIDVHDHASLDTVPYIQSDPVLRGDLGIKQERVVNWSDIHTVHYIAKYVIEEVIPELDDE